MPVGEVSARSYSPPGVFPHPKEPQERSRVHLGAEVDRNVVGDVGELGLEVGELARPVDLWRQVQGREAGDRKSVV